MTKLVICLLFFGLFAIQTVGHMNSDPAPGRSPGPPPARRSLATAALPPVVHNASAANEAITKTNTVTAPAPASVTLTTTAIQSESHNNNGGTGQYAAHTAVDRNYGNNSNNNKDGNAVQSSSNSNNGNTNNNNEQQLVSRNTELTNTDEININLSKLPSSSDGSTAAAATTTVSDSTLSRTAEHYTYDNLAHMASARVANGGELSSSSAAGATAAAEALIAQQTKTNTIGSNTRSCHDGFSDFLNDVVDVEEEEQSETNGADAFDGRAPVGGHMGHHLFIDLRLEHHVFETSAVGINCGLMYQVRLMTYAKPTTPQAAAGRTTRADADAVAAQAQPLGGSAFVEANTTTENTSTKAKVNSQEDMRDRSNTANVGNDNDSGPDGVGDGNKLHYTGEFFVETLSTLSGRERGSFVDHHSAAAASNKLPISWFSSLQRNDASHNGDDANADDDDDDDDSRDFEAEKNDFNSAPTASDEQNFAFGHNYDAIGSGHGHFQQQQQQQHQQMFATKWLQQSWDKATNRRSQNNNSSRSARKMCPENKWHGSAKSQQQQHKGADRDSSSTGSNEYQARRRAPGVGSGSGSARDDNSASGNEVHTESLGFWMLNELCEQDDTIEFRVFFRATFESDSAGDTKSSSNNNNNNINNANGSSYSSNTNNNNDNNNNMKVDAQHVVFKKTFKFQLRKDCQLLLREVNRGHLDYTALPLYSNDCTVHFPPYRLFETERNHNNKNNPSGTANAATGDIPPAGILVDLQRLNVPCNSGGFIRFNERTRLCGKLEELNAADRSYHFDVRSQTTVHFHKSPMFSLSYKLVDYCYNLTTSNQSGEYYVRPSMRDAVECYFRIHLPYGNRISLTLVTNNDSAILQPNDGIQLNAAGEQDTFNIYTTEGLQIDTQRINLTALSGSSGTSKKSGVATSVFRRAEPKAAARTQAQEQSAYTLRAYNASREHVNKRSTSSLDGFLRIMESKIKEFSFAAGGKSLQGAGEISNCDGVIVKIFESDNARWSYCINDTNRMQAFILTSTGNTLNIHLYKATRLNYNNHIPLMLDTMPGFADHNTPITSLPTVYLSYVAQPIPELVASCDFGWVAMQQFCINAIEVAMSWPDAEEHCVNLGGHLASIRNEQQQQIIHEILFRSPGYDDQNAYWVGGSDSSYEGDFRWSDGLLFQYTNWFPGWTEHSHYNKQPNDDGLSSQDCIELRRFFRTPPGIQTNRSPLTSSFMWNDRDCSAKNFLICERPMSDDSLRRSWINDCNKTVSLTKEHPRASIWSPSFPRQYPDNANCFTTITAPTGYRVVIEFEELVIENEAGCTYDYLEITEPTHYDNFKTTKSSKNKNTLNINNSSKSNLNINKTFRKRSSYEKPSLSSSYTMPTSTSTTTYTSSNTNANAYSNTYTNYASTNAVNNLNTNVNLNANVNTDYNTNTNPNYNNNYLYSNSYNNYNLAQTNYQKLLHIFSSLYRPHTNYLIQTPDYPHGNPNYPTNHHNRLRADVNAEANALPKRLCGDWSSKLKLLRHVSTGSYLGLHFVSDYSHHFGGYKAKTYMENTASECANERLKYYNGSCYLFISYPEVDWWTAQQVCRGMGAQLSSVSSADEHRFITSNIRNQIDYSPQLIYWLGAELEKSGQFEWTDDTRMSFQGWLPGQGQFEELPSDAICLGLQWKMSPTPMLPSGLYWQSQKCSKVGGYVCKKAKDSFGTFSANNLTITGAEGRLVSPAYPSTYPINLDYWVHIKTPERTRIILQFQKIDLEPQDECLYDYVSIQDYELVSHITLEPGSNPLPMAMLTSEEEPTSTDNEVSLGAYDNKFSQRPKRSLRRKKRWSYTTTTNTATNEYTQRAHAKQYESSKRTHNGSQYFSRELLASNSWLKNTAGGTITKYQNPKHRRRKAKKLARRKRNSILVDGEPLMVSLPVDNAQSFLPYVRWCGTHTANMSKFDFVSSSNEAMLNFHSDYSVNGIGFAATWKAIDVSGCPLQTLTSREGTVISPNYPHFLLNNLNCAYVIQAPAGRRVWLEFSEFDLKVDAILEVDLGSGLLRPFHTRALLSEGLFVSEREQLRIQFRTGQHPRGKGFQAVYRTVAPLERRERIISLQHNSSGYLYQLNYPHAMPENVDFTHHLVAPFGQNILLELHGVEFSDNGGCPDGGLLEVFDNYADNNGTKWQLCKFQPPTTLPQTGPPLHAAEHPNAAYDYLQPQDLFYSRSHSMLPPSKSSSRLQLRTVATTAPPVYITSYLNTLHIRQRTGQHSNTLLNATVTIQWDNTYKMKLTAGEKTVESCQPNPCQFNGKCVLNNGSNYCQCQGHYTGRFCGLNICELEPCVFGKCELTTNSFKCQCQPGYMGHTCELKQRPCAENPCEGRGACFERNGGYFCRCHAWWEGARCERRMLHIPYKPLSERMLQEPFWLGLITVFVVLAVIGLVWCAKRHFPEKIEKLLAEEADRNRPPGSIHGHHHHTSLREQLQFTTAIPQSTGNIAPGTQRSIFNRLGIRKPSLLSLSSPNPIPGGGGAAARTFSLDDLLRPPPRRSPSPRKKRNNSTPVKKNAAEKKQILQQLVSPATNVDKPKVSLGELINMTENRLRASTGNVDSESDVKETTFSENSGSLTSTNVANVARTITDPKLEKKVTFARLLNKVSAEMSSGSDMDIGHMTNTRNSSALSLPTDLQFRASSVPPSPCTNDIRSPHSTSSNQGSDSLSSSDLALTDFGLRSMQTSGSEIGGTNHNAHLPLGIAAGLGGPSSRSRIGTIARPKVSSADSILAMFRNLASSSSSNANANAITTASSTNTNTANITHSASVYVSPSTTPTASSPQDDAPGDDESSTSSMHTPVSFSSGPPDSPVFYRQTTIEVPVLDVLNAHKSSSTPSSSNSSSSANLLHPPTILLEIPSNGINNKCLSPIREMPTPMPSPALTPIMPRPQRSNSPIFQEDPLSIGDYSDDEQKSIRSDCSDEQMSEKIVLDLHTGKTHVIIDSDVETTPTDTATTSMAGQNRGGADLLNKLPLLKFSPPTPTTSGLQATNSATNAGVVALKPPAIVIDVEPPTPEEKTPRPRDLIIPTLTVEHPSPTRNRHPMIIFPGSPPPQRASIGETSFMFPNKQQQKRLLKQFEKPNSLEFPFVPPMITVTSNMSELESDTEPLSPATKTGNPGGLMPPNPVGMCYLSPFTMCSRADRTISESNLSSSGYSSMASPGPSRCGSSNPLCPGEMDEPGSGHSGGGLSLHVNLLNRRKNSALASCKENITNGKSASTESGATGCSTDHLHRPRSDSETFSDEIILESNDEGIGTDHVDERMDDCRLSSNRFKTLGAYMAEHVLIEVDEPQQTANTSSVSSTGATNQMAQLQLPSIVIQIDGNEKGLSPVSSRSESPLSERASMGRFSPHFYGRKDQLPFTDSDGLYDFPSSDGKGGSFTHQRRSSSKKRERKSSKCSATQSPTKQQLDIPSKESLTATTTPSSSTHTCSKHCLSHHHPCPASAVTTRKSPKRRLNSRPPVASSSSSSESLVSPKELAASRPLPRRLNSPNREKRPRKQESLSEEEVADALLRRISPSIVKEDTETVKPKCKINRLRAIGNQIRFLRRLKKSIKTRERLASPSDSCPEENTDDMDSPQATSPLLQPASPSKTRIALCRQKRLPSGTYGITAAALNSSNWKGMDRSLIGDDLNSD